MRHLRFFIALFLIPLAQYVPAQELSFEVILDDEQVQTQDRQIFSEMQRAIETFINNTKWTEDEFEEEERIRGNILITFTNETRVASGVYQAQAQIQTTRPIYGTSYTSSVLNFFDSKFNFRYQPSEPLIFTENVTQDNLTSMLAYYAYAALALDYDTFGEYGGNPYYEKMRNIVNNLNASTNLSRAEAAGWQRDDTRNRIWLSEDLNNAALQEVRVGLYRYHRHGLDKMLRDAEAARQEMLDMLERLLAAHRQLPNSIFISAFFDAKANELYQTFSKAKPEVRQKAGEILLEIDPTNGQRYRELTE